LTTLQACKGDVEGADHISILASHCLKTPG
jgi:hypothetical protein